MKLKTAWKAAASDANKASGLDDLGLKEHLEVTGQTHLFQSKLLLEVLEELKSEGLIEEAYLRGSLGRGHADEHSDIDLFAVVLPENLEKVYAHVSRHLEERGRVIINSHDRLVEDYGGIGFMFVARDDKHGQAYQFDLYLAIKGVAPLSQFSIRPRIYSRDPSYKWMEEYGNTRDMEALPETAKAFIRRHTTGSALADRIEILAQETMLSLFVTSKHIKRGQTARLVIDNNAIVSHATEMLQTITGYTSNGYTPAYLGNEIVDFCRKNGDAEIVEAAGKLEKLFTQEMNLGKLRDTLSYCRFILEKGFPEKYENLRETFDVFEQEILAERKAGTASPAAKRHTP